ncbi:MAG: GatB/YqeY domain-containing protein [Pyrinomonadaceae bacterium]|nr:GatB/YqeY domain-containing protein [Pyrinomonadaceae bacterium]MCX7639021.1 GatB/YqeY domain-containing protein [Pyrinomonadaceae bacterium]MDW8303759.1 GatB/YqeY domain-containing protein [Acidobacteriota bacterium]
MSLKEKIIKDLTAAMKAKDSLKTSTLRMIKTAITNRQIEKGSVDMELSDEEILKLLQTLIKQRKESIEQYKKAGRHDLVEKEEAEVKIIEDYLPQSASIEEIQKAVEEAIIETKASSAKDMGAVMKTALAKLAKTGKLVDRKLVNQVAREKLQST